MQKLAYPFIALLSLIFLCSTVLNAHVSHYDPDPDLVVSGVVKADDGTTLPGATILVKGTDIGTITDTDGKFSFSVKQFPVILIVTYIGYSNQESTLNLWIKQCIGFGDVVIRSYKRSSCQ